jgi:isoleucyl-tRNA synthetase
MPFLSERLYRDLVAAIDADAPESVHLTRWPLAESEQVDSALVADMRLVKNLVRTGHAARNTAAIRVRQPLAGVAFGLPSGHDVSVVERYQDVIAEELNVKAVEVLAADAALIEYKLKPVDTLGRELRKDFPAVRKALVNATAEQTAVWGPALLAGQGIDVTAGGKTFTLRPEQIIVQQAGAEGYAVAESAGVLAALKTELSEALIHEGLAREVVRRIQQLRKDADLAVSDRIAVGYQASERLNAAIAAFSDSIAGETLAESLTAGAVTDCPHTASDEFDGEHLTVGLRRLG